MCHPVEQATAGKDALRQTQLRGFVCREMFYNQVAVNTTNNPVLDQQTVHTHCFLFWNNQLITELQKARNNHH